MVDNALPRRDADLSGLQDLWLAVGSFTYYIAGIETADLAQSSDNELYMRVLPM